jgi:replicative DNA helicase
LTTSRSEDVLYSSLTDVEALERIARSSLDPQCIPTVQMRQVVTWAVDYFDRSSQTQAPSRKALMETWGEMMEQIEVEVAEEDVQLDTVSWALEMLASQYVSWRFQQFQTEAAMKIAESSSVDRVRTLEEVTQELVQITLSVRDRTHEVEGMDGFSRSLADYENRAATAMTARGMTFGIPTIDDYTFGIHPGELAVLAAPPKTGKSVIMAFILLAEWLRNRMATYYTLENSVGMTYDRLVCILLGVDHKRYMKGQCEPEEVDRVRTFLHERGDDLRGHIRVISPQRGQRTVQWMTRHARTVGTQSLLIDQLTFIEPSHRSLRGPDAIKDIMHELKEEVSTGSDPMSTLLAHQINRDGIKAAKTSGFLSLESLAEGSEVERTVDWAFGLYASHDERVAQMMKWQTMAGRRADELKTWRTAFRPWINQVETIAELEVPA